LLVCSFELFPEPYTNQFVLALKRIGAQEASDARGAASHDFERLLASTESAWQKRLLCKCEYRDWDSTAILPNFAGECLKGREHPMPVSRASVRCDPAFSQYPWLYSSSRPTSDHMPRLASPLTVDVTGWRVFRNEQYSFELRYPADYAIVQPHNQLQPSPVFRVWFTEASLVNSPTVDREPPQFAVDVYGNASQQPLDAWLTSSGVTRNFTRPTQEAVRVGGVKGIRLTDQTMLAPNSFYYVARGPFVYRFTPLGGLSHEMLATVRLGTP